MDTADRLSSADLSSVAIVAADTPMRRVLEIGPVPPLAGNVGLGFAALSYAGALAVTVVGDADACPEVDVVASGVREAWDELRSR